MADIRVSLSHLTQQLAQKFEITLFNIFELLLNLLVPLLQSLNHIRNTLVTMIKYDKLLIYGFERVGSLAVYLLRIFKYFFQIFRPFSQDTEDRRVLYCKSFWLNFMLAELFHKSRNFLTYQQLSSFWLWSYSFIRIFSFSENLFEKSIKCLRVRSLIISFFFLSYDIWEFVFEFWEVIFVGLESFFEEHCN